MNLEGKNIGFAFTGSFCTFKKTILELKKIIKLKANVTPIMSFNSYNLDTKFGEAKEYIKEIEEVTGKRIINTIQDAEPIGPKSLLDLLIIAPCTGNTLGKMAMGITDTSVTMAAKAHLRNEKPLLIAPSTNDALGASAKNIGLLHNTKNIYFVPYGQDAPDSKHSSCVADFSLIPTAVKLAFEGKQMQPIIK